MRSGSSLTNVDPRLSSLNTVERGRTFRSQQLAQVRPRAMQPGFQGAQRHVHHRRQLDQAVALDVVHRQYHAMLLGKLSPRRDDALLRKLLLDELGRTR